MKRLIGVRNNLLDLTIGRSQPRGAPCLSRNDTRPSGEIWRAIVALLTRDAVFALLTLCHEIPVCCGAPALSGVRR